MVTMDPRWQEVYEENKRIDDLFIERYGQEEFYFEKNVLEFLVELGEFTNETKCFKYWTVKKSDKEKVLDEFADCITMILLFFHLQNLSIEPLLPSTEERNPLKVIHYLYVEGTKLMDSQEETLLRNIFSNLLYVATLFGYSMEEILEAIYQKQKITKERLNTNY